MKQSTLRLHAVRFKNGGQVRVIQRDNISDGAKTFRPYMEVVRKAHGEDIAGYAIVLWARDMSSTAYLFNGRTSTLAKPLIPDFVRNRLLSEKIEEDAVDTVMNRLFGHRPPEGA